MMSFLGPKIGFSFRFLIQMSVPCTGWFAINYAFFSLFNIRPTLFSLFQPSPYSFVCNITRISEVLQIITFQTEKPKHALYKFLYVSLNISVSRNARGPIFMRFSQENRSKGAGCTIRVFSMSYYT